MTNNKAKNSNSKKTSQPVKIKPQKLATYKFKPAKSKLRLNLILLWLKKLKLWQKILLFLAMAFVLFVATLYVSATTYKYKHRHEKVTFGVTFIADYARYLSLDPKTTMLALRDDLGFRRFRLVSYWDNIEKTPGNYDFSELDWQFNQVEKVNGQVTLAIGLRQPRWPECHEPEWAKNQPIDELYPKLEKFIKIVVNRYKDRASLVSYQLENEYFLKVFGQCQDFSRSRLQKEFNLVKKLDPKTPIILSLANNYFGLPIGQPRPDIFGVSVYKRVFDYTVTHRYFEYPFPPWYYTGRAGLTELFTGKSSMLHELQAEPWPPMGILEASTEEQDKSMDAKRLKERISYGRATGFKQIDLWGGEWWYWRMTKFSDPSLWNTIKQQIPKEEM